MNMRSALVFVILGWLLCACNGPSLEKKGFAVPPGDDEEMSGVTDGVMLDSGKFETRPSSVLLTGMPQFRLVTVYKVNYNKREKTSFIGSNDHYYDYRDGANVSGNQWNSHLMPGMEAVHGYNMVNIAHYDIASDTRKNFFEKPVLIRTLYYPSFSRDTLDFREVQRNYFMISVHDEDTNGDGFIDVGDLRRFYLFDADGTHRRPLVPLGYSVFKSEYDPGNDFMHVFAQLDENKNGSRDEGEAIHIFWIDLKDPNRTGRLY